MTAATALDKQIERYRQMWAARFEELDKIVEQLKQKEKSDGRNARK
jgi:hypothetical protein